MILNPYGGPGGWDEAARMLGLGPMVGVELDEAACRTRAAAGHLTIRADVAALPAEPFAGKTSALIASPPCQTFSAAGSRAGTEVLDILAEGIRDAFAGRPTRAQRRREMAHALRCSRWLASKPVPQADAGKWRRDCQAAWKRQLLARKGKPAVVRRAIGSARPGPHLTRTQRMARIWAAVRSASLVIEPARLIRVTRPEWVALEQVPAVLPLWRVYAAELRAMGYSTWAGKLNSADFGVPQTRERAILIASRIRRVSAPVPTHYDPSRGMQLFGEPWVSMAAALQWGASGRPAPAVTAGGTATGGAEPFGHRDRDALAAEQEAGRWELRIGTQANATCRPGHAPADTIKAGHSSGEMRWVRTSFGTPSDAPRNGSHVIDATGRPAHTVTGKTRNWVATSSGNGDAHDYERDTQEPSPSVTSRAGRWTLHTNRDQREDGTRQTADPHSAPAPALTAKSGGQWVLRPDTPEEPDSSWFLRNNNNNACTRSADEPAGTLFSGQRSNWAAWVRERPATTVQGDPRIGRPGHKDRDKGEAQFAVESVRITVREAAILQSFRADYPWKGSRTAQFRQVGDAFPPLLAMHVLAEASGVALPASETGSAA